MSDTGIRMSITATDKELNDLLDFSAVSADFCHSLGESFSPSPAFTLCPSPGVNMLVSLCSLL